MEKKNQDASSTRHVVFFFGGEIGNASSEQGVSNIGGGRTARKSKAKKFLSNQSEFSNNH